MHSPLALIHAVTILNDITDIQISFCKIVIAIAKSDEVGRENFIRFHIQEPLIKLILKQHSEISKLACITIKELCVKEYDIKCLCETTIYHHNISNNSNSNSNQHNNNNYIYTLIDSIIALLDALPNDIKIQIEGLKILVIINQYHPDIILSIRKISFFQILKKTRKFLNHTIKAKQIPSDYDIKDVENLLDSQLWNKDKCIIS